VSPSATLGKRHLEPHIHLDELRNLHQSPAKGAGGIGRAVGRLILGRIRLLQHGNGFEGFPSRAVQHVAHGALVKTLEAGGSVRAGLGSRQTGSGSHTKGLEIGDGERVMVALQASRNCGRHGYRAKRGDLRGVLRTCQEGAVQPTARHGFAVEDARFHEILCVKVGSRDIVRTTGLNDRQVTGLVNRQEWRQRRMQPEEPIQVRGPFRARRAGGLGNGNILAMLVVVAVAERHNHRNSIRRATLEDADEDFPSGAGADRIRGKNRLTQEGRAPEREASHGSEGQGASLQKKPS